MANFLSAEEYTWLCDPCRATLATITTMFEEGTMPDTDDEEAPINYMYDHRMYCGKTTCINGGEDG